MHRSRSGNIISRIGQAFISLEWHRDPKGYRLIGPEPPVPPKPLIHPVFRVPVPESLLGRDVGKPQRIVRRGGRPETYRPLEQFDSLFKLFVNDAVNAQGLLGFIEKFGPLTPAGKKKDRGDPVDLLLEHAAAMREFLSYSAGDGGRLIERIAIQHDGVPLSFMSVRLTLDP